MGQFIGGKNMLRSGGASLRIIMGIVLCGIVVLTGCENLDAITKQHVGTAIGVAAGIGVGSRIGKGSGRVAATVVGAGIGGWIGNRIGAYLDEQDQGNMRMATQKAAMTGQAQQWSNPNTGISGRAEIVRTTTNRQQTSTSSTYPGTAPAARLCRTIRQTIVLADGTEQEEMITSCQGSNGWEVV